MQRTSTPAKIGPNAAIQLAAALVDIEGGDAARNVFSGAGLVNWLDHPPTAMIDQTDAARLHHKVRAILPSGDARAVFAEAGRRTGAYILAHRIPKPAQAVLKALPSGLALPLLLTAIQAHAWTFVGSGVFHARMPYLHIEANPLAEGRALAPQCVWHECVFETLIRALVSSEARVTEVACCAMGAPDCVFEIWSASRKF
jgi:divinyl protochlorophyllide a 8-vinyl-reductase